MEIERIPGVTTAVGEGPIWDVRGRALWFVDIVAPKVLRLADGSVESWTMPSFVGAVAPTEDGRAAVLLADGFGLLDPATGTLGERTPVGQAEGAHLSEGKVDREGRFVGVAGDSGFIEPIGGLYRWDAPGTVTRIAADFVLGNGPCWSIDGRTLYVADSRRNVVYSYPYPTDGSLGERRIFFDARAEQGFPDGATVDSEGRVWIVLHRSPWIVCIDSDGREVRRIEMPSTHISSLTFGGSNLDELYVTSLDPARVPGIPAADLADLDDSERGLLYRISGLGVTGVAEPVVTRGFRL